MSTYDDREVTNRTQGVWTTCDDCGNDWWCVVGERDYLDEPVTFVCSGGCDDGWPDDDYADYDLAPTTAGEGERGEGC